MSKIASKIIALAATLALLVGFVFAGAYMQIVRAAVESADKTMSEVVKTNVTNRVKYGDPITVSPSTEGTNGYTRVTVKNPGGVYVVDEVLTESRKITANQVGIYEVTYYYDNDSTYGDYAGYTYNVEVYMDYEYKLVVEGNGAGIPTYWGTDSAAFDLPTATLYYLDEDTDTWFPDPDSADKVSLLVTQPNGTVTPYTKAELDEGRTMTTENEGMYFFTYYANVGDGDNLYTQEYTTQVQNNFSDSAAPTLSISGVPASSSTNTEISLPTATVNDDYDGTRVNTTIRVTHTYANYETYGSIDVAQAVVDQETGYVVSDAEKYYLAADEERTEYAYDDEGNFRYTDNPALAVKATFDNDSFMSFYPTESGTYSVSYQAMDSTGRYEENSTRNRTVAYSYPITVSDTTAPVYYDIDESLIPSTWGRQKVYKLNTNVSEDATDTTDLRDDDVSTAVQFPIPVVYDNTASEENLSVSFTLTDPSSRTVLSFNNIYATTHSTDNSYTLNGENYATGEQGKTYYFFRYWLTDGYTVNETTGQLTGNGLTEEDNAYSLIYYNPEAGDNETLSKGFFEFSMWVRSGYLGQYTATYRARDNSGNSASRTYNITLQQSFEDLALPTVDFDQPDYFIFRNYETEQTINNVSATDSNDARLDVQYYVLFNQASGGLLDQYISDNTLSGDALSGEINEIADENKVELNASGITTLTLETTGTGASKIYEIKVDDIHGNEQTRTLSGVTNNIYIVLKATDSAGNTAYRVRSVKVLDGTVAPEAGQEATYEPVFGATNSEVGQAGDVYNFGSFTINYGDYDNRLYTGFELYVQRVQDDKGLQVNESPLDNVSFEYYYDAREAGSSNQIHVDNIRFTPSRAGTYMIVARGFHVSGASNVKIAFVDIEGSASNTGPSPTADISASMNYNVTYTLPTDYDVPAEWGDSGILRSISGGRCTVMGNEFTALQAVTYKFNDYVFEYDTAGNTSGNISNHLVKYAYTDGDSFAVSGKSLSSGIIASSQSSKHVGTQVSAVSDSQTAVFRLLGVMPTYTPISTAEESVYVTLPNISASSVNGNATSLTVTITDQDGYEVAEVYDKDTPVSDLPASLVSDNASTLVGNMFAFEATKDGTYTVTYNATLNNQTVSTSYTIRAGKVTSPGFTAEIGYINDTLYTSDQTVEASVGDSFDFADIKVTDTSSSGYTYQKTLVNPDGDTLATITVANRQNDGSSYEFTTSGSYRVTYTVTDDIGNTSYVTYTINVTTSSSSISSDAITTLAVVLIVVGVLLIAGVIVWFIRFRKRKG